MPAQPTMQLTDSLNSFMSLGDVITLLFYITAIIYIVYSVILYYHWTQYGTNKAITGLTLLTYGLTTVPLILIMAALTFSF
jgi:heme/copper-type cytochrome/quinol oxidase subunit 2